MQTEKKTLTKREQTMMLALVIIAVFAVMILYVIIPSYNRLVDKQDELSALEYERTNIVAAIAAEQYIRENHSAAVAQHRVNSSGLLAESMTNEIGRMLTSLCERHGLQPIDQNLMRPVDFFIDEDDGTSTGDNDVGREKDTVFLVITATMTLQGEYGNLMQLLDTVEGIEYIRISRVTYVRSQDSNLRPDRMVVQFEVTMLKDAAA